MSPDELSNLAPDADPSAIANALRAAVGTLNGADELDREAFRRTAIATLELRGVKGAGRIVAAALKTRHSPNHAEAVPTLVLRDPVPADNPVNGPKLLTRLADTVSEYVALPPEVADAIALLIINAHAHDAADISPIGVLSSPTPRCGKTKALSIIGALTPRSVPAGAPTAAALFRTIEKFHPTLLIDEADAIFGPHGAEDLRGLLDAGHTRTTAFVIRTVGDDHEPKLFSTWCPKFIALIGKLPATLQDRAVVLPMRRVGKRDRKSYRRLRLARVNDDFAPLCGAACRWASDHLEDLRQADPLMPDELDDRAQDNWRPLIAIAEAAGGDWPARARKAALVLSGADTRVEDEGHTVQLLADIRQVFVDEGTDQLASATIIERLTALEERPWSEWRHGKPLTPRGLAELLRPFGIRPGGVRVGTGTPKGYKLDDFRETFGAYFSDSHPQHPQHSNDSATFSTKSDPQHGANVADRKFDLSTEIDSVVADVADWSDQKPPEDVDDVPF